VAIDTENESSRWQRRTLQRIVWDGHWSEQLQCANNSFLGLWFMAHDRRRRKLSRSLSLLESCQPGM
jgi:hypothetical protein